ncbi:uncharacterized protein LOC129928328 [Biomphalaria glabrata]|uniref:Uncharacterized protein LOC129928328 n=1 Tax=Biomphalaria glabrata TaxID=6526 RepID=A0A9W3BFA1_BIOGL|nr:uncharacterized protein LOC129928328 [Biomphalaria glabrata]
MDNYGAHEAQVSEGGEADLHRHLADCTKNPGHRSFIPVDTFTLDYLPESQRDLDLCELIKCVADLTVRVSVRMTSPGRPKFWPDSTLPYPCSNKNGGHLRTGSGKIRQVLKYEHTACRCDKCKQSEKLSDVWWVIGIQTATHVVYDDVEAETSNIRLFYDKKSSPLFVLDNVRVWSISVESCFEMRHLQ